MTKNNIILCGMQRAGKSTVGTLLAKNLGRYFYDTDRIVDGAHAKFQNSPSTVRDLHGKYGEDYFRSLEKNALFSLQYVNNGVIATGAGIYNLPESIELIKEMGKVIFLKSSLMSLENQNEPDYSALADLVIPVDGLTAEEIVTKITLELKEPKP